MKIKINQLSSNAGGFVSPTERDSHDKDGWTIIFGRNSGHNHRASTDAICLNPSLQSFCLVVFCMRDGHKLSTRTCGLKPSTFLTASAAIPSSSASPGAWPMVANAHTCTARPASFQSLTLCMPSCGSEMLQDRQKAVAHTSLCCNSAKNMYDGRDGVLSHDRSTRCPTLKSKYVKK